MSPKQRASDEAAVPERKREFTAAPTKGGAYAEDGSLVHETQPEADEHRMKQPER